MNNVLWIGSLLDPSGYGEASRGYVTGLAEEPDLRVRAVPKYFWHGPMPSLGAFSNVLSRLHKTEFQASAPYVMVQHLTPDNWRIVPGPNVYHVGVTTFETDRVPAAWQQPLRTVDELWTFSEWGKQVFESQGIRRHIEVVEHGVDTDRFCPNLEPLFYVDSLRRDGERFVFGSNFDWTERKNPTALLAAYFRAFEGRDDVSLVIKAYFQYPYEQSRQFIMAYIRSVREALKIPSDDQPPVYLLSGIMSDAEVARFYNSIDAYVLPSRGEGWGLTYSEAMSCGVPTIAVNWSGHTQFMNHQNSLLIDDYKLVDVTKEHAGAQPQYIGHRWADVDIDALSDAMMRVREDAKLRQTLGQNARNTMLEKFTWRNAAEKAANRIRQIG